MRRRGAWPGLDGLIRVFSNDTEKRTLGEAINALGLTVKTTFIDVEKNASDAVDAIVSNRKPAWNVIEAETTTQAQVWDLIVAKIASSTVLIPAASRANAGCEIAISREHTCTAGVVVKPISGLVNGSASSNGPAANRIRVFVSNGIQWVIYA